MRNNIWTCVLSLLLSFSALAQLRTGLSGTVTDPSGALIPAADVSVLGPRGFRQTKSTDQDGKYLFSPLEVGNYTVAIKRFGFKTFTGKVNVTAVMTLDATLTIEADKQAVTVNDENARVGVDPTNNAGQLVLRGADLDALSDDPDQLAQDLQALAGPSAGPNGGQIYIDGFSGGNLPPKSSIREIRVNASPFSAEYDRIGFGRIEIFTKPGTDKYRGQASFGISDKIFNSRNPFVAVRPEFQSKNYGFNFGGPLSKKSSFNFNAERRDITDSNLVYATILDKNLQPSVLSQSLPNPQSRTSISPRLDYALNSKNTLVGRYMYSRSSSEGEGTGDKSLASRAYDRASQEHSVQLTETFVVSARAINETRFQFMRSTSDNNGDNTIPTISVLDAFTGGGAQIGKTFNHNKSYELTNMMTITPGRHSVKFGGRLRGGYLDDSSPNNFGGSFTFTGNTGPQLDANNQPILGTSVAVNSLEAYRRTLYFQGLGMTGTQIRALGGGASQFSLAGGTALASISQTDIGVFLLDDFRWKPNVTLSYGIRYENQNNISSNNNFAPRFGLSWGVGANNGKPAKFVIRAGTGIFYDRFQENFALQALRFNGNTQHSYIVQRPDFFPTIPTLASLTANQSPDTIRKIDSDLHAPYLFQTSVGIEKQLRPNITWSTNFTTSRGVHMLRTRNINSPFNGIRPLGNSLNYYQYESTGLMRQNQLMNSVNVRLKTMTLFGFYVLGKANGDTDGAGTFPAYNYDLHSEYSRTTYDTRHRLVMGGNYTMNWGKIAFSPFVMASSGNPYNITTGRDLNGDSIFNDRPSFAAAGATGANIINTSYGLFNVNPGPNDALIPRNLGRGPSSFTVNMRASKSWGFGSKGEPNLSPDGMGGGSGGDRGGRGGGPPGGMMGGGGGGPRGGGGGGGGMRGGGGGGGDFGGGASSGKRFNLNLSISARNLLNHVNYGSPSGNLSSALFGQYTQIGGGGFGGPGGGGPGGGGGGGAAGNRRVDISLRLTF